MRQHIQKDLLGRLSIENWRWRTVGALRQQTPPAKNTAIAGTVTIAAAAAATDVDELKLKDWDMR